LGKWFTALRRGKWAGVMKFGHWIVDFDALHE
jgi:hypothetical protein